MHTFVERMYCDDCGGTFPHCVTLSANTRITECLRCFMGVVSTIHIPDHEQSPRGEPLTGQAALEGGEDA